MIEADNKSKWWIGSDGKLWIADENGDPKEAGNVLDFKPEAGKEPETDKKVDADIDKLGADQAVDDIKASAPAFPAA